MSAFTSKTYQVGKAPKLIRLIGDKARPESAQHILEFPGGAIEVSRTTDGAYWAHIIINHGDVIEDAQGRVSARGVVCGSRIFRDGIGLGEIESQQAVSQIAVLVRSAAPANESSVVADSQPDLFGSMEAAA